MAGSSSQDRPNVGEPYEPPRVIRVARRGQNSFFTPSWDRMNTPGRGPVGLRIRGYCYPNSIVHRLERDRDSYYYEHERYDEVRAEASRWRRNSAALHEENAHYSRELSRVERRCDDLTLRVNELEQELRDEREAHEQDVARFQRYRSRVRERMDAVYNMDVSGSESEEEEEEEEEEEPSEEENMEEGEPSENNEEQNEGEIRDIEIDQGI